MWKQITSKEIFNHPRLTLVEDEIELPNGHRTTYLRAPHTTDVNVMVIGLREDGRILIEQEYSYPPDKILWQFPGGGGFKGEAAEIAANREFMEEAGYRGELIEIGKFLADNRRSNKYCHVFVARHLVPEKREGDIEEDISVHWKTEDEINAMIANGEIINVTLLAGWTLYQQAKANLQ